VCLQLRTWNKPHFYDIQCSSCSVFTVCATCNVISPVKCVLYFYISTTHSVCAVPYMAAFCSTLISCLPGMLLRYCLSDYVMVQVAPVITGITFAFTFRVRWISIMRSLYFKIFSVYYLIIFLPQAIATSNNIYVPCLLPRIMMSGLSLGTVLLVRTYWLHNMVNLPSWVFSTDLGTWS